MKFPIAAGNVKVNVDIDLISALPSALAKTKTIAKATGTNGDKLFCMEIDSAPASESDGHPAGAPQNQAIVSVPEVAFVQGGALKLDWSDCADSSYHGKVTALSPNTLTLGKKATVTGTSDVDEQVTGGSFTI